jgi:hypothetical protein
MSLKNEINTVDINSTLERYNQLYLEYIASIESIRAENGGIITICQIEKIYREFHDGMTRELHEFILSLYKSRKL